MYRLAFYKDVTKPFIVGDTLPVKKELHEDIYFIRINDPSLLSSSYLVFYMDEPTKEEIEQITTGKINFTYYLHGNVLVFGYKIGELPWYDIPIPAHVYHSMYGLHGIILVDKTTNTVIATRDVNKHIDVSIQLQTDIFSKILPPVDTYEFCLDDYNNYPFEYYLKKLKIYTF